MERFGPFVLALALLAPVLAVSPSGMAQLAAPAVTFVSSNGNEWWVQVAIGGADAPLVTSVDSHDTGGAWVALTQRAWGAWAGSYHVEPGHLVTFRATLSDGRAIESCPFSHPQGVPMCAPIPAPAPAPLPPPPAPTTSPFNATFVDPRGNAWWIESNVATSGAALAGVDARVAGGTWTPLSATAWGSWARSIPAPAGSLVELRARSTGGASVQSAPLAWPPSAPAPVPVPTPVPSPVPPPSPAPSSSARVTASPSGLFVGGAPFLVKAVAYNPTPIGGTSGYDWFAHPEVYKTDLPKIRAMGANGLRVYHMTTNATNGRAFLDEAQKNGLKVIVGDSATGSGDATNSTLTSATTTRVLGLVDAYKDHPAVLLWMIGNEIDHNYRGLNVLDGYHYLDTLAVAIHARDANHPVGSAFTAGEQFATFPAAAPHVDVYGVNLYMLDVGQIDSYFHLARSRMPDRPVLVTEFGVDAWNSDTSTEYGSVQASLLQRMWLQIANQHANDTKQSAGGVVFAWVDEWWKSGSPSTHDGPKSWTTASATANLPDGAFSEEYFGIVRMDRTERPAVSALRALWS